MKSLEQVAQVCEKAHKAAVASQRAISQGQSVVTAKPSQVPAPPRPIVTPIDLLMSTYYCKYCR